MLVILGTFIAGLGGLWLGMTAFIRLTKDVPLGPVPVNETNPVKAKRNDQANIAAQYRLYHRFKMLIPLAIGLIVVGVTIIIIGS